MANEESPSGTHPIPQAPFAADHLVEAAHVLGDNPILVVEWQTRRILACTDAVARVFGYTPAELIGGDTRVLHVSDASFEAFGAKSEAYIRSGATSYHCRYRMRRRDGSDFPTENVVQVIRDLYEGTVAVVSFVRDLSACGDADRSPQHDLADDAGHPLAMDIPGAVFQRIRDPHGRDRYSYIAGRLLADHGLDYHRVRANPDEIFGFMHPEDRRLFESVVAAGGESLAGIDIVLRMYPPDGSQVWLRVISRPTALEDGSVVWDGIAIDISREKNAQELAAWLASHDQLTGLMNRAEFSERLTQQLGERAGRAQPMAVGQIGVRGMLKVNESHGFAAGDDLLYQFAQRLRGVLAENDIAARSHGDIFLVKLDVGPAGAEFAAAVRAIRSVCDEPFRLAGGQHVYLDVSLGLARFPWDAEDPDALLGAAALACDRSHKRPEGDYEFYDSELGDEVRRRFRMEGSLRSAIEAGELQPYYQPQVALADGSLVGLEALVRWPQADGSLVSPGDFVPLAEQTGLIMPMGHLLLGKVVSDVQTWMVRGFTVPPVAVNCSPQQLRNESFVEDYRRDVLGRGVDAATVHLEITESTLVDDFDNTERTMAALTGMGVRFSIDDFGTGFSSLGYLSRLPFHVLKIDRSFVNEVTTDQRRYSIVLGLVRMASALGLYVIAEGIETAEQAETMREIGCDAGQGFLYDAALPPEGIERWLAGTG